MQPDYSLLVGPNGTIAKSGKTIYDSLHEGPGHLLPSIELEAILKRGLLGLDLNYPLRTRSKVLKTRICEILGYPVPASFKKTQPRFPAQDFDTYIQKSNNLQIWNQEIAPTRRYVIIRLDEDSRVTGVRVVAGEILVELDTTGTLTKKYQAKSREPVTASHLLSQSDSYPAIQTIAKLPNKSLALKEQTGHALTIDFSKFLPIADLYRKLLTLAGERLTDPGLDQERNRGAALHRAVCDALDLSDSCDTGACPDITEQLLEIKLQTASTIDLGLISPDDPAPLDFLPEVRHCDVRYAVFYGAVVGNQVRLDYVVLTRGADFFSFFQRFEGKVVNAKLQIPLPRSFFT
jgi:hypothetical protein